MWELKPSRTLAHLWLDGNYTGISFPFKTAEQKLNAKYILKCLFFVKHLEEHPEVKGAPVNPGEPMCKICNKTIDQIFASSD